MARTRRNLQNPRLSSECCRRKESWNLLRHLGRHTFVRLVWWMCVSGLLFQHKETGRWNEQKLLLNDDYGFVSRTRLLLRLTCQPGQQDYWSAPVSTVNPAKATMQWLGHPFSGILLLLFWPSTRHAHNLPIFFGAWQLWRWLGWTWCNGWGFFEQV